MRFPTLSALALVATVVLPSCNNLFHPRQGADAYGGQQPSSNPYGTVPQSNPYATPPANTYGQPAAGPYSQAPSAPSNPYNSGGYEQPQTYPSAASSSPYSGYPTSGGGNTGGGGGGRSSGGEVTVQSGDNLTKIANRNGTTVSALKSANGLTSDLIRIGQKLRLP